MQSHFLAHHCRELGLILNRAWLCVPNSIFTCYFYLLYFYFFRGGGGPCIALVNTTGREESLYSHMVEPGGRCENAALYTLLVKHISDRLKQPAGLHPP